MSYSTEQEQEQEQEHFKEQENDINSCIYGGVNIDTSIIIHSLEDFDELLNQDDSFLSNIEELDINDFGYTSMLYLPQTISKLFNLTKLTIHCYGLTELPDALGQLIKLESLNIASCYKLNTLPDSICNLINLKELKITACANYFRLPYNIGVLINLKSIFILMNNHITHFPDSICLLINLTTLNIHYCSNFKKLPNDIDKLKNLQILVINNCELLENLPDSICNLPKLEYIKLSNCSKISELPEQIGKLLSLREIDISCCYNLKKIPDSIGFCNKLENIKLFKNTHFNLYTLPPSMLLLVKLNYFIFNGVIYNIYELQNIWFNKISSTSVDKINVFYTTPIYQLECNIKWSYKNYNLLHEHTKNTITTLLLILHHHELNLQKSVHKDLLIQHSQLIEDMFTENYFTIPVHLNSMLSIKEQLHNLDNKNNIYTHDKIFKIVPQCVAL